MDPHVSRSYNCCTPPPKLTLGKPPRPPWMPPAPDCKGRDIIDVDLLSHEQFNRSTAASVSAGGNAVSVATVIGICIVLLILIAIILILAFLFYKKHYLKYQVSPSRALRCHSRGSDRPLSQQALVLPQSFTVDNTSQTSVTSDEGPLPEPDKCERYQLDNVLMANTSDIYRPRVGGPRGNGGGLARRGLLSGGQPDIVESTLPPSVISSLPVLRPLQSSTEPTWITHDPRYPAAVTSSDSPRLPPLRRKRKKKKIVS